MYKLICKIIFSIPSLRDRLLFTLAYNKWGHDYLVFRNQMKQRDKEVQAMLDADVKNGIEISDFT